MEDSSRNHTPSIQSTREGLWGTCLAQQNGDFRATLSTNAKESDTYSIIIHLNENRRGNRDTILGYVHNQSRVLFVRSCTWMQAIEEAQEPATFRSPLEECR